MKKEEIKKFYLNYRLYIFPAVVVFSSLILIIFVIYPQIISLLANQTIEKNTLNKSKFLEAKAQTLESYDLEDLSKKVNFALGSYPTDRDSIYALGILQRLVAKLGFNVITIALGAGGTKDASTQSYNFKLEVLGPIAQLSALLNTIENSPRLMRVSGVEVSGATTTQGIRVSLGVEILYAAAPTGFGSIDSPLPDLSEKDEEVIAKLTSIGITPQTPELSLLGPRGKANPFE